MADRAARLTTFHLHFPVGGSMDAATPERWLSPCAETVVSVAEAADAAEFPAWREILRRDPAAGWFLLTHQSDVTLDRMGSLLRQAFAPQSFLPTYLHPTPCRFADWSKGIAQRAYRLSQQVGAMAERLADHLHLDTPLAQVLGQLTQLGTLVASQRPDGKGAEKASGSQTRQLIRRARIPAWTREILLALDLPVEPAGESRERQRWIYLLQAASGLVRPSPESSRLALAACRALGVRWEEELEFVNLLRERAIEAPVAVTPTAGQLLARAILAQRREDSQVLSFTVKQLENEVEDLRGRLGRTAAQESHTLREQRLTAVAELAAGAGHEINNPLAVISGQAQYLLKQDPDLNQAKSLERIIAQTNRIHTLLRDLMFYARPPQPQPRTSPVAQWVQSAIKEVEELALTRGVKIEWEVVPARLKWRMDPTQARMAVRCLAQNGIEAAPQGGWVRVSCREQNGVLRVDVEDNGPGVPAQWGENVFDPFFSGRVAGRGVGLGLSKVWRIAQLHGGEIILESERGQVTRFSLRVPSKPANAGRPLRLKKPA